MATKKNKPNSSHLEKINMRKEIDKYLKNWPWFVLSLSLCIVLGYLYLRYTTPLYNARTTIIIKDESSIGPESMIYADLGLMGGTSAKKIENEIGILRSRNLMNEVVKSLNLNVQYYIEGNINTLQLYEDAPFTLNVLKFDENLLKKAESSRFEISETKNEKFVVKNLVTGKTIQLTSGSSVNLGFADIILRSKPAANKYYGPVIVQFFEVETVASFLRNKIKFIQEEKNSNLIELEITDPVKEKARDILDQLILEYNRAAIEDKNLIAGNTSNFINERLAIINDELESVETGKEIFKEQNMLTDIHAESQMFIQNASDYNKKRQETGTQLELSNAMLEYISTNPDNNLLPTNLGFTEGALNDQIDEYNSLVLQRNRLLAGSSDKNPVIVKLNSNIEQIKANIIRSLSRARYNLQIAQDELNRQASQIGSKIFAVPSKERQYRGIERQQNIKETLYLFLLQKREENSLSMAVTEPKAKIVDRAYFNDFPVSPNSRSVYLGTLLLGMVIPFLTIYTRNLLDRKIRKRTDIESFDSDIALVGEIPQIKGKEKIIISNDRSVLAESFRILNTNLQYLLVHLKEKSACITILITSTIKGEGKTFTAVNLAVTLANTSKKVLLLGADLRESKLDPYVTDPKLKLGISDYLIDDNLILTEIIQKSNLSSKLDVLLAGNVPPNPYELLKTSRMDELLEKIKGMYDFVIIDTAPSMLVADTFVLTPNADLILYLVKAGYTEKELLEFPADARIKGRFHNVGFVLNNVNKTNLGYGNSYGYGYGKESQPFRNRKYRSPAYNI